MKKILSILLIAIMFLMMTACGGSNDKEIQTAEPTPSPTEQISPEPTVTPEDGGTIKDGMYTLPSGLEVNFSTSVRNDKTGNWRISTTSDSTPILDCAVEYYGTLFSSDDEVHAVWNTTLGTMTRITVGGNLLFVDTFEYVKGEEHDADLLFTGESLNSEIIDLETGEPLED